MTDRLSLVSHDLCPYVQRAAIALMEKGVAFDRVTIDLDDKPDWFRAISPLGKVPLLLVPHPGGPDTVLFESSVICEWIEETQAAPALHPADATARARHRAWMEFGSTILSDIYGLETARDAAVFETKRQAVDAKLARLEDALGHGPYFAGDAFSFVDAVFAPVFRYFDTFDTVADLGVFAARPRLSGWRKALAKRVSVQRAVGSDYGRLLHAFLVRHDAHLLRWRA